MPKSRKQLAKDIATRLASKRDCSAEEETQSMVTDLDEPARAMEPDASRSSQPAPKSTTYLLAAVTFIVVAVVLLVTPEPAPVTAPASRSAISASQPVSLVSSPVHVQSHPPVHAPTMPREFVTPPPCLMHDPPSPSPPPPFPAPLQPQSSPPPPPAAPPRSPPLPPPNPPPAPVVDIVNARFREGRPSSDLNAAGILFHMFDQGEMGALQAYGAGAQQAPPWSYEPWMPCPSSMWCAAYNDRLSASLLNRRIVQRGGSGLSFFGGVGVIYAPAITRIWCSFVGDGGTMHPDAYHGCGMKPTSAGYCNPNVTENPHQCPWRPQHLDHMLATFESKPYGYNEVLVATPGWEAKLPELIEAIMWVENVHIGRRLAGGSSEAQARGVHAGFLRKFPHARPRLLKMDLSGDLDTPFTEASTGPGTGAGTG